MVFLRFLCIFIMVCICQGLSSQDFQVSGRICSDGMEPLTGASIKFTGAKHDNDIKGTVTDINGDFSLSIEKGLYKLQISYIGYFTYETNVEVNKDLKLPVIKLNEDIHLMDEIVVIARTITHNANGYIVDVSKNPFFREQDMNHILKMTPGTNTTTNGVQVYGQDVAKIYLNGRELKLSGEQLLAFLGTIEGKNIKRMEVVASSGSDEDANVMGRSIIKITTFNPETGGMLNVGNRAVYGDNGRYGYVPNINFNWRISKKWSTYFNGNAIFSKLPTGSDLETHFYDTDTKQLNELNSSSRMKGMYRGLWGISYDWNVNNLFSLEASCVSRNNNTILQEFSHRLENGIKQPIAEGNVDAKNKYIETNVSFMYTHKFNDNAEISFQTDRLEKNTTDTDWNHYTYWLTNVTDRKVLNKERQLFYTARVDYTQRFKRMDGIFKMGVKYTNLSDEQDTDYVYCLNGQKDNEMSYLDLYEYSEEVYAAYAKYSFKVSKFDVTAGIRMEHALLSPHSLVKPDRNHDSKHTNWAPELGVNYVLNKEKGHNIAFQYSGSIKRPLLMELNPMVKRVNEYSYSTGNPLLKPSIRNNYLLRAVFFNDYILALNHFYSGDNIITLPEIVDGIIYSIPQQGLKYANYSVYVGFPIRMWRWGRLSSYVMYDYSKEIYLKHDSSFDSWKFGTSGVFQLSEGFNLNMNISGGTPIKSLYGEMRGNVVMDFSISKLFFNRSLNVSFIFNDLLNNYGTMSRKFYYNDHSQISKSTVHGFNYGLSVRYTFRWGQKSNVRQGGSGNMEESVRLSTD